MQPSRNHFTPPATGISRRAMLRTCALSTLGLSIAAPCWPLFANPAQRRYKIGACDWSIGKMSDPGAFAVAKEIGLDGLQVSLGTAANNMHLRNEIVRKQFLDAAQTTGVAIASLGIAELNNVPYKSDARATEWVEASVDAARALGVRVVLLAFFSKGDLRGDQPGVDEVVRRLRAVAPKAEKAGVILGIESWLSAAEHVEILDRVGSKSVQVYYDVCNSNNMGYDIYSEIRTLGRHRICELHAKENGALLGKGKVDFQKVREALDAINYEGWIQIEGAVPKGQPMLESYKANCRYLRGLFTL